PRTTTPPNSTLFPYTTLFRSQRQGRHEPQPDHDLPAEGREAEPDQDAGSADEPDDVGRSGKLTTTAPGTTCPAPSESRTTRTWRSEEHTSELQSLRHLVCRLL